MSAVEEYARRLGVEWPPSANGFDTRESPVSRFDVARHAEPRRMRESDFGHWTPEGRETLRRILERVMVANGRRSPV